MQSVESKEKKQLPYSGDPPPPPIPPKSGLKRMQATSRLENLGGTPKELPTRASSILQHSVSTAVLLPSSGQPSAIFSPGIRQLATKPRNKLTRTKTVIAPAGYFDKETNESGVLKRQQPSVNEAVDPKGTPSKLQDRRNTGEPLSSTSSAVPTVAQQEIKINPPTVLQRSSSGTMLLRGSPRQSNRYNNDMFISCSEKKIQRSESISKLDFAKNVADERLSTPGQKKRSSSLTCPPPLPDPQSRRRPHIKSEGSVEEGKSPVRTELSSPLKKRIRQDSGSRSSSPLKKRYTSTVTIPLGGGEDELVPTTPLQRKKSTVFRSQFSKQVSVVLKAEKLADKTETMGQSSSKRDAAPKLAMRSTSGDSYYSAIEGDEQASATSSSACLEDQNDPNTKIELEEVFVSASSSLQDVEMVPLVKKQMSVDEKIMEDDEDEGFGDSTKTIKKGQGAALARSLSLKLSPRKDQQKPIGTDTEKSCSTPSLPTDPLLRQGSASPFRFRVSPSTFKPISVAPVVPVVPSPPVTTVIPASPIAPTVTNPMPPSDFVSPTCKVETEELSEPSTSNTTMPVETTPEQKTISRKSSLKKTPTQFVVRENHMFSTPRRRNVRYDGLKVYYFDRKQGDTTVPTEGEVSLGMLDKHHAQRYFPLNTGKRPKLDLLLYSDEDLSDGEVITPDSDEEDKEYDEYASAKFIPRIIEKTRMRLLKKSGVKADKSGDVSENLRVDRLQCGCSCENGICLPETCQCALDEIQCQVDGGDDPTHPCVCVAQKCENPEGRIFYDQDVVRHHRIERIMNWNAGNKSGLSGSPVVTKFKDSDDEDQSEKPKSGLIKNEESPVKKYPVTPVYTRRARSSLSDIRESTSEANLLPVPLAERMNMSQHLENEACVEEEEEDAQKNEILTQEIYEEPIPDSVEVDIEPEILETAMSPVKATLVA